MEKISQILDVLNRIDRLDIPDKNETLESILKFASSTLEQLQEKQEKQEKQDKLISESNILPLLESDAPESSVSNKGRNFASSIPILKDKNGTLDYPLEILMEIFENSYWDLEGRKLNHSFYNFYDQYSEPDDIYGLDRDVLSRAQEISLPVEIHIDFIPDNYNLKRDHSL